MNTGTPKTWPARNLYAVVLEDDSTLAAALVRVVASLGYDVDVAGTIARARELVSVRAPEVMLVDVTLPDGDGLEFMVELQASLKTNFVVITGDSSQQVAVKCIRAKAFDMLPKPIGIDDLKRTVKRAIEAHGIPSRDDDLTTAETIIRVDLSTIGVGTSVASESLRTQIRQAASGGNTTVVIRGAPGTEKNAVAEAIHARAGRKGRLILVNCAIEVDDAAEIRFFGSEAVGGRKSYAGYLEQADAGTLVLDDVAMLPLSLQAKLLAFLDKGHFRKTGATGTTDATVAVAAIVRSDSRAALESGSLRRDFHDRVSGYTLTVPGLVDRLDDLLDIAGHLLREINERSGSAKVLTPAARQAIQGHSWPGNVRELKNVLHRAALQSGASAQLDIRDLEDTDVASGGDAVISDFVGKTFWQIEKELLYATLDHNSGDKETTARMLGISLKTLYNRLHAYS